MGKHPFPRQDGSKVMDYFDQGKLEDIKNYRKSEVINTAV